MGLYQKLIFILHKYFSLQNLNQHIMKHFALLIALSVVSIASFGQKKINIQGTTRPASAVSNTNIQTLGGEATVWGPYGGRAAGPACITQFNVSYGPSKMDIYTPNEAGTAFPAIIYVHGFDSKNPTSSDKDHDGYLLRLRDHFSRRGVVFIAIDYNFSTTTWDFAQPISDVRTAFNYVKNNAASLKIDPNKIFLAGESMGASLAMYATYETAYVSNPAPVSPVGVIAQAGFLKQNTFNSPANIKTSSIPLSLIHDKQDNVVPINGCADWGDCGSQKVYDTFKSKISNIWMYQTNLGFHTPNEYTGHDNWSNTWTWFMEHSISQVLANAPKKGFEGPNATDQ